MTVRWTVRAANDQAAQLAARIKSCYPHQTEIIRTLSNQGSYFSLQEIILVFKYLVNKLKACCHHDIPM